MVRLSINVHLLFFSQIMMKNIHKPIRRRLPSYSLSLPPFLSLSILSYPHINQFRASRLIQRYILYTPYRSLTHTLYIYIIDVNPSSEPAGFVEYRYVIMNVYYRSIYTYKYIYGYFILEKKLIRQIFNQTK
jgi:hypothetical protein